MKDEKEKNQCDLLYQRNRYLTDPEYRNLKKDFAHQQYLRLKVKQGNNL